MEEIRYTIEDIINKRDDIRGQIYEGKGTYTREKRYRRNNEMRENM